LTTPSTLQGFDLVVWALPGDTVSSIEWAVTSGPFGGTTYIAGTNT
jgi:hypothetical protein